MTRLKGKGKEGLCGRAHVDALGACFFSLNFHNTMAEVPSPPSCRWTTMS